jgi:hypothetical protein
MCTLSWKPGDHGYVLFFNRDEQRTRAPALPPTLHQRRGRRFIAPTDASHGGTWLLVNDVGIAIGLLNHYPRQALPPQPGKTSRGLLPLACADCSSVAEVLECCANLPLAEYAPFQLVAADALDAASLTWDGRTRITNRLDPSGAMLTSSSFSLQRVAQARRKTFERIVGQVGQANSKLLETFHLQQGEDGAASVRMSRQDACTHSLSRITVSEERGVAEFDYRSLLQRAQGDSSVIARLDLKSNF